MHILKHAVLVIRGPDTKILLVSIVPGPWKIRHIQLALQELQLEIEADHDVQIVGDLICEHSYQRGRNGVCRAVDVIQRGAIELRRKTLLEVGEQPRKESLASTDDVEAAVPEALTSGSFFFADIERNQVDATGLTLLRALAREGEGAVIDRSDLARRAGVPDDELDRAVRNMLRREVIEQIKDGYGF